MKLSKKLLVLLLISVFVFSSSAIIQAMEYNQAPMLEEKVDNGEIPPLAERLPKNPWVIPLQEEGWGPSEIGEYGGTLRRAGLNTQTSPLGYTIGNFLSQPDISWPSPKSNIGKPTGVLFTDWSFSEDSKSFTAHIREGVKWSDGEEFTAEDYIFGWRDVITNEEIGAVPATYVIQGEVPQIEKIDKYTIKWIFPAPYPAWETILMKNTGTLAAPKHYLAQFHPEYNEDLQERESPYQELIEKNATGDMESGGAVNPERPVLWVWTVEDYNPPEDATFVRNPYYFAVDPDGNQLPYIDRVKVTLYSDPEVLFLNALSGKFDFQRDHIRAEEGKDVIMVQNREKGDYHFNSEKPNTRMMRMLFLNWDTPDEKLREFIRKRDFRIALSHAINRSDINQVMYNGRAIAKNHYYANLSPYYEEGYEQKYTEYDPEKASEMLDELGIVDKDGDDWREYPDGSDLMLVIDATPEVARVAHAQMVVEDWKKIGLNAEVNSLTGAAFMQRIEAGMHDMVCDWPGPGTFFPETDASTWAPVEGSRSAHHVPKLTQWYTSNGERGHSPVENSPWKELRDLVLEAKVEPNREKRTELYRKVGRIHANRVLDIGLTSVPQPQGTEILVSNDLTNTIDGAIHDQNLRRGQVFYFSNPERR